MSKKVELSVDEINKIQKLLNDGCSIKSISKIYEVSEGVISRIIKENDLQRTITNTEIMRRKLYGYEDLEKEICIYYQTHKITMNELGKIYGLGICCIESILKRHNIDRLSSSEFVKKYTINEEYFSKIDTDNKAYILGFLYADGCASSDYLVSISLQAEDVGILKRMQQEFGSDRPLVYLEPPKKYPNRKPQYRLVINNKRFYEKITELGVIPGKSYTAKFPYFIDEKYYRSFIRGVFDGDGCLYHYDKGNTNTVSFTGTSELINGIGDIIEKELNIKKHIHVAQNSMIIDKNTRVLMFGGNNQVKKFLDWLYFNADIYLERKYKKYCELYNINNSLSD